MTDNKNVTDSKIRAENLRAAPRDAGGTMSDGLIIATELGGPPDFLKPLAVHVRQTKTVVLLKA